MRQPKPFFRKFTGTWYVQIGKQQINLGHDEADAFRQYHELMCKRGRAQCTYKKVPQLLDAYLEWLEKNRAKGTYDKACHYLSLFAQHLGSGFAIAKLEGIHVTQWLEANAHWAPSTGNDAVSIVQRAFRWAVKRGHLSSSPVAFVEGKPQCTRRETVFSPAEWQELRALVKDQQFP